MTAVPVLMYHEIAEHPQPGFSRYTVSRRNFARQMRWLAVRGYHTLDMDALLRARTGRAPLPERPIVLTFDDGFLGCADHAVPLLRSHGFTAVFFLVTGLMGKTSRWLVPELGLELPLMSWDTARALAAEGFQFGAHTVTHPRLTELDPERQRAELADARRHLEDELGRSAVHLAYPYGAFDAGVRDAAADAGYATACSTRSGLSGPDDDPLTPPRPAAGGTRGRCCPGPPRSRR